jgi:hypothetical protein
MGAILKQLLLTVTVFLWPIIVHFILWPFGYFLTGARVIVSAASCAEMLLIGAGAIVSVALCGHILDVSGKSERRYLFLILTIPLTGFAFLMGAVIVIPS